MAPALFNTQLLSLCAFHYQRSLSIATQLLKLVLIGIQILWLFVLVILVVNLERSSQIPNNGVCSKGEAWESGRLMLHMRIAHLLEVEDQTVCENGG